MAKPYPRCTCVCRNGTQCGRRVTDNSQPPICHIHRAQQQGQSASPMVQPVERTPEEILRRLMADRDPVIRLRAVNAWLDHEAKRTGGCPACEARAEDERWRQHVLAALTADERARLDALIERHTALKEEIYARDPKLRPVSYTPPSRAKEPEPSSPSVETPLVGNDIVNERLTREAAGLAQGASL